MSAETALLQVPSVEPRRPGRAVRLIHKLLRPVSVPLAARSLRRASARARTIEQALLVTSTWSFLGLEIAPWQMRSEIQRLLELVAGENARTVVEIGTSNGGSLYLLARVAAPDAQLISVDLPRGPFGGGYAPWRARLYGSFARQGQRVELLRGDSHSQAMFDQVRDALGGRAIDFLFIDADHSYAGVKSDFDRYSTLVRPGGVIALHDIVPQGAQPRAREGASQDDEFDAGEVSKFWQELRESHEVTEFVEDWSQGCFGIGVVRKPS